MSATEVHVLCSSGHVERLSLSEQSCRCYSGRVFIHDCSADDAVVATLQNYMC
jgi:hypothetical protein